VTRGGGHAGIQRHYGATSQMTALNVSAALKAWRKLGVQLSAEELRSSYQKISAWQKKAPACSRAPRKGEGREISKRPVTNLSHKVLPQSITTFNLTQTYNRPIRAERAGGLMGIKKSDAFPKKYLRVEDLDGRRITAVIDHVKLEEIGDSKKAVVYWKNDALKPLPLNVTNWSAIEEIAGTDDTDKWTGVKVVLYPSKTDFQGKRVPCIRIDAPKPWKPSREPGDDDEAA
jgi:hypothetical protein